MSYDFWLGFIAGAIIFGLAGFGLAKELGYRILVKAYVKKCPYNK